MGAIGGLVAGAAGIVPSVRPLPALMLAALAALGLIVTSFASNDHSAEPPGARIVVRFPAKGSVALSVEEASRALRAAGWPESQMSEALEVAGCESGWRPAARGLAGEVGLFQIHPVHAARFDFHGVPLDPSDPVHNAYIALRIWEKDGWAAWSCRPNGAG